MLAFVHRPARCTRQCAWPWTLSAIAAIGLLASCAPAARPLPWDVEIPDATLRTSVRALVATIHEGTCAGPAAWTLVYRPSAPPATSPPELGPGDYAFEIVARDAACQIVARACVPATLPLASGAHVTVTLTASAPMPACPMAGCMDGLCQSDDAGPPDAGRDGAPSDVGTRDAAMACPVGRADCNFDPADMCEAMLVTLTDCGSCGTPCDRHHATATCASGACAVGTCDAGFDDCNGTDADGCETSLDTTHDCGSCGMACSLPHAVAQCGASGCEIASCHAGWADCDTLPGTGCEASLASATSCGACTTVCDAVSPLCGVDAVGTRACVALCAAPAPMMCGTSCVDPLIAVSDCGGCGTPCVAAHREPTCSAGACGGGVCDTGWADCNGDPVDGCERSVTTSTDCGACGTPCASATADTTCASGSCEVVSCAPGTIDCDGDGSNGCETDATSPLSCGACGVSCSGTTSLCGATAGGGFACVASCAAPLPDACSGRCVDLDTDVERCGSCTNACSLVDASALCRGGICRVQSCDPGLANCNADPSDGCETNLATDTAHCGDCGNPCPSGPGGTAVCSGSTCSLRCDAGRGDCDGMPSTGCERSLDTLTDCGGCGVPCAPASATGECTTGTCTIVACAANHDDCDGNAGTGCEADLLSDRRHCGSCSGTCNGMTGMCCNGTCAHACP
jgi:hypothetical protein